MFEKLTDHVLDRTAGAHAIEGATDLQAASCHMATQCRRRLLIYTQRLSHPTYDQQCFVDAVKALAIGHGRAYVRILLADTEPLRQNSHRLLMLGQRLSSSIAFRLRAADYAGDTRSFMLADEGGYILRPKWYDLHDIKLDYDDRLQVRKLEEEFLEIWEQSEPDPELRRLSI